MKPRLVIAACLAATATTALLGLADLAKAGPKEDPGASRAVPTASPTDSPSLRKPPGPVREAHPLEAPPTPASDVADPAPPAVLEELVDAGDLGDLRIHATTAAGLVPEGLKLALSGSPRIFAACGLPVETVGSGAASVATVHRPLDSEGVVVVPRLRADVWFDASIADATGRVWSDRIRVWAGFKNEERVRIRSTPRDISIRVRSASGDPIHGAHVSVGGFGHGIALFTDRDGLVTVEAWKVDAFRLAVAAGGFAPHFADDLLVPPTGARFEVSLRPGRSVTVHLRDATGRAVPGASTSVRLSSHSRDLRLLLFSGRRNADGPASDFEFSDLPEETVTLTARVAGRTLAQEHHTGIRDATIPVPEHGSLALRWNEPLPEDARHLLYVSPKDRRGEEFVRELTVVEKRASRAEFPVIFPGSYTARLEQIAESSGRTSTRNLLELPPLTIRPGRRARALLAPAADRDNEWFSTCSGWRTPTPRDPD